MLILDNHAGYISWEDFHLDLRILEENSAMRRAKRWCCQERRSVVVRADVLWTVRPADVRELQRQRRQTTALCVSRKPSRSRLSGVSVLGSCSRRGCRVRATLGSSPASRCSSGARRPGATLRPTARKRQSLALAIEQARYEVDRARRQYDLVDPANRLVAGELESRWNAALSRMAELDRQLTELDQTQETVTPQERARLLELGCDLPGLWRHPAATAELKKRLLRAALQEVVIADNHDRTHHVLRLHWKGGVHTELRVKRVKSGEHRHVADPDVITLVGELSKVGTDQSIAATLNRLGYRTGTGKTWRAHSVASLRYYHQLPNYEKGAAWLTVEQTATTLDVSHTVIRRLIAERTLPATQVVPRAPWIIARESISLPNVQAAVEAIHQGRQLRKPTPGQQELPWK